MSNKFDFSDNQMSWLNCPGFMMSAVSSVVNTLSGSADDEEDWFFPQPTIDVPQDPSASYKKSQAPVLPPVIYLSGMDLNCKTFDRVPFNLADFNSWDEFINAIGKYIYISVVDADNCNFDDACDILSSEELFDNIIDNYKSRI